MKNLEVLEVEIRYDLTLLDRVPAKDDLVLVSKSQHMSVLKRWLELARNPDESDDDHYRPLPGTAERIR